MQITELIAKDIISVDDLANASELVDRAKLVNEGIKACKLTIKIPLGMGEVDCYHYEEEEIEYEIRGTIRSDGVFTCYCEWWDNWKIGQCNLFKPEDVFLALENKEFKEDLERFLKEQINKANTISKK